MNLRDDTGNRLSAVELAHREVRSRLRDGATAVDATAGNGHDTVFLARCVGPAGQVYAVDLQPAAIEATRARLAAEGLLDRATLRIGGHENLRKLLPEAPPGSVAAVMFNLGYLPGGDKTLVTRTETTLAGLEQAMTLLAPRGVLAVVCYPGHPGGDAEADEVVAWARSLPADRFIARIFRDQTAPANAPFPIFLERS